MEWLECGVWSVYSNYLGVTALLSVRKFGSRYEESGNTKILAGLGGTIPSATYHRCIIIAVFGIHQTNVESQTPKYNVLSCFSEKILVQYYASFAFIGMMACFTRYLYLVQKEVFGWLTPKKNLVGFDWFFYLIALNWNRINVFARYRIGVALVFCDRILLFDSLVHTGFFYADSSPRYNLTSFTESNSAFYLLRILATAGLELRNASPSFEIHAYKTV